MRYHLRNRPRVKIRKPTVTKGILRISEVEQYRDVTRGVWETWHEQLSPGQFGAEVTFLQTPSALLYEESFEAASRITGSLRKGLIAIASPSDRAAQGRWWGRDYPERSLVFGRGGDGLDLAFPTGYRNVVFVMDERAFREMFLTLSGRDADFLDRGCNFIAGPEDIRARLQDSLGRILALPESELSDLAGSNRLELALVGAFVESELRHDQVRMLASKRRELVAEATRHFVESNYQAPVSHLCSHVGVSKRSLEYAFRENLGAPPSEYFKRHRLNQCRQILSTGDPAKTSVKAVALSFGFQQSGRFAQEYRNFFGETPSETLRRLPESLPRGF